MPTRGRDFVLPLGPPGTVLRYNGPQGGSGEIDFEEDLGQRRHPRGVLPLRDRPERPCRDRPHDRCRVPVAGREDPGHGHGHDTRRDRDPVARRERAHRQHHGCGRGLRRGVAGEEVRPPRRLPLHQGDAGELGGLGHRLAGGGRLVLHAERRRRGTVQVEQLRLRPRDPGQRAGRRARLRGHPGLRDVPVPSQGREGGRQGGDHSHRSRHDQREVRAAGTSGAR